MKQHTAQYVDASAGASPGTHDQTTPPRTRGRKRSRKTSKSGRTRVAAGPLTPRGRNGKAAHNEAVQTFQRARRRARVAELFVHNRVTSINHIVAQLAREGITTSNKTVCQDLHAMKYEFDAQWASNAQALRRIEVLRTEQADRAVLPGLDAQKRIKIPQPPDKDGQPQEAKLEDVLDLDTRLKTYDRLMTGIDKRAKLQGLYGGDQPQGYTYEEVHGLLTDLRDALFEAFGASPDRARIIAVLEGLARRRRRAPAVLPTGDTTTEGTETQG